MEPPKAFPKHSEIQIYSTESLEEFKKIIDEAKDDKTKTVGTHSGVFHADEVLGCAMLKYTNAYRDMRIVRSRNQEINDAVDILIDVGSVFDEAKLRYDHHQKSFTGTFNESYNIKLSSAGLVYKFHGKEIIKNILVEWKAFKEEYLELIYLKLYDRFMVEIDAIDNGVSQSDKYPAYNITTNLSSRISRFNPPWNPEDFLPEVFDQGVQFRKAMDVADEEFLWQLKGIALIWLPAFSLVKQAFDTRADFHESEEFILLSKPCPWKEHLFNIEEECKKPNLIKFVFYKDERGLYRVQAVPLKSAAFSNRVSLAEKWRGLRGDELKDISGFDDIDFVHHSGFIGGARSLATVVKMAEASLKEHEAKIKTDKP